MGLSGPDVRESDRQISAGPRSAPRRQSDEQGPVASSSVDGGAVSGWM
jgi:hypothetical protein